MSKKIVISTYPFGEYDQHPLNLLRELNFDIVLPPPKKKLTPSELRAALTDAYGLIAGTEKLDHSVLSDASQLKIISRVGIGLDNVDFDYTNSRNIIVTNTPDAPSRSVAELTIGLMIDLARSVSVANQLIKKATWQRITGELLYQKTLGIIGMGRVGKLVASLAKAFNMNIIAHDIHPHEELALQIGFKYASKEEVIKNADFLTLHLPLTSKTKNYLSYGELKQMKQNSFLINTARGGIVDESALLQVLNQQSIAGAALDVFQSEPYNTNGQESLAQFENVILTAHMGSCSREGRFQMETEAALSICHFFSGRQLSNIVRNQE